MNQRRWVRSRLTAFKNGAQNALRLVSPDDIKSKSLACWDTGRFLRTELAGPSLFPWEISFSKPKPSDLTLNFSSVQEWLRRLRALSKERVGYGYVVSFKTVKHRRLGAQSLPSKIVIESREDFLKLLRKEREFELFLHLHEKILAAQPLLKEFLIQSPLVVLTQARHWDRLLAVCDYFVAHPRPGLYMRQLDIPGVDTKFIEVHRGLLLELLDLLSPSAALGPDRINGLGDHGFERRFGLLYEPPVLRFRILDPSLALNGLTDVTTPIEEFKRLRMPLRRVFITENKMNGLCFPACPDSVVIFGLGYGIGALIDVDWLKPLDIYYWGDIDTHGFAILDRLRVFLPQARSVLMDQETLIRFKSLWTQEAPEERFTGDLPRLTPQEATLFQKLRDDVLAQRLRLEQERIGFGFAKERLQNMRY